jgi:hypothetical protein
MAAGPFASMLAEWIARRRAQATGAAPPPAAPDGATGPSEAVGVEPPAAPDAAQATDLPARPYPNPQNLLERQYNQLWEIEQQLAKAKLDAQSGDDGVRIPAEKIIPTLTTQQTSLLSQIGQQENREADNRRADEQRAQAEADRKQREADAKAERDRLAAAQPKNGDTRTTRVEHNGITAVITERYQNGQWSYVQGSAKPDTGILGQPSERTQVDLETARVTLQRAQAQLAAETDPLKREQLQVQVEQARVALQQAQQNLNKPTDVQQDGYLVRVRPDGTTERIDTLTPDQRRQRDEATALDLEARRRGQLPTNAYAALQQETQRLQGRAQQELDRLKGLQEQGVLSAEQASSQFQGWFQTYVAGPLAGLRAQAEEAQRAERQQVEERNRLEDIRVQQANQQREQLAQQYGEQARSALVSTFPSARSPEFAAQYGANVAAVANRAGGRTAEERMAAPRGPGYTGAAFSPQNIVAVMPDPDTIARAARDRALAAIAPAQAIRSGSTAPTLPGLPDISELIARVPYSGPLAAAPSPASGLLPTPGREAVDLGTGRARTYFGPDGRVYTDWDIR